MSHELDKDKDGNVRMMYNLRGGVPWHKLGQPVEGLATAEEAIEAAKLDWEVELLPVYQKLRNATLVEVPEQFLVVRDEDEKVLGRVSKRYVPVQNRHAFDFLDALVDSDEAKYDTAGALREGKQVFLSAKLPTGCEILGDEVEGHLLLTNSHTGLSALTVRYVMTRVVCANTLQMAFGEATPVWSFPHVTGIDEQLEQARETLQLVTKYQAEFRDIAERLADTKLVLTRFDDLLLDVLPERMANEKTLQGIKTQVATSPTIGDEHRRDMWGVLQGLTEWTEHVRPARTAEGRFHAVIDGDVARTRDRFVRKVLLARA